MKTTLLVAMSLTAFLAVLPAFADYAGHGVTAQFTESGRYFLVNRGGGYVLWDIQAGTLVKKLPNLGCSELKPMKQESQFLCSSRNELAVWDWQQGTKVMSAQADMPFQGSLLGYIPRTNQVVTRQGEGKFTVWAIDKDLRQLKTISVEGEPRMVSPALSPETATLAIAQDKQIHFHDLVTGQRRTMAIGGGEAPRGLVFSSDGQLLAASIGNTIVIIEVVRQTVTSRATLSSAERARGSVMPRVFTKDGRRLVADNFNWSFPVFDVATGNLIALAEFTYIDKERNQRSYTHSYASAIAPDGNLLIAQPEHPYTLQRWNLRTGTPLPDLCGEPCRQMGPSAVGLVKCSPDASRVVIGINSREVAERYPWANHLTVWDVQSNTMLYVLDPDHAVNAPVKPTTPAIATAPVQAQPALKSAPGTQPAFAHQLEIQAASLSPKGNLLVTTGADALLKIWDPVQGTLLRQLPTPMITALTFSPDGSLLVAGTDQGQIRIWETDNWREYPSYSSRQGRIRALAFAKSPNVIVIAGSAPQVPVVDIVSQQSIRELIHTSDVHITDLKGTRVERSKQGDVVLTAAFDRTANVLVTKSRTGTVYWNLDTWQEVPRPSELPHSTVTPLQPGLWLTESHESGNPNEFTLAIWDRRTKTRLVELDHFTPGDTDVMYNGRSMNLGPHVALGQDTKWAAVTVGEKVSIWDLEAKQKKANFFVHMPRWLGWTADGKHLVIKTEDRKVLVWSAHTLQPLHYLKDPGAAGG